MANLSINVGDTFEPWIHTSWQECLDGKMDFKLLTDLLMVL